MSRNAAKQRGETKFVGELQRFTDPPGGASLDDPVVRSRKRNGLPGSRRRPTKKPRTK